VELMQSTKKAGKRAEAFGETREEKRARLDAQTWTVDEDPLMQGVEMAKGRKG